MDAALLAFLLLLILIGLSQSHRLVEFWAVIVLVLFTGPRPALVLVVGYAGYQFFKHLNSRK